MEISELVGNAMTDLKQERLRLIDEVRELKEENDNLKDRLSYANASISRLIKLLNMGES